MPWVRPATEGVFLPSSSKTKRKAFSVAVAPLRGVSALHEVSLGIERRAGAADAGRHLAVGKELLIDTQLSEDPRERRRCSHGEECARYALRQNAGQKTKTPTMVVVATTP